MTSSLLVKLGALVSTMAVVFWIGWIAPGPADRPSGADSVAVPEHQGAQSAVHGSAPASTGPPPIRPATSEPAAKRQTARLDANRATAEQFESLPGIGPVLAKRIVDARRARGSFRAVEDLRAVKGIGKKKFEHIRALIWVAPAPMPEKGRQAT